MSFERKTAVYFDGACHLCSREIDGYRKRNVLGRLEFVDISKESFDAVSLGLDPEKVERHLHVQTADGRFVTGVDAFAEIWRQLEILRGLIFLVENQPSRSLFKFGYSAFALVRPLLPKKACKNDQCAGK